MQRSIIYYTFRSGAVQQTRCKFFSKGCCNMQYSIIDDCAMCKIGNFHALEQVSKAMCTHVLLWDSYSHKHYMCARDNLYISICLRLRHSGL